MNLSTGQAVVSVQLLFISGCFTMFYMIPYYIIRYINLKMVLAGKGRYLSKFKSGLWAVVCVPVAVIAVMCFCEYFGDSSFLGFFMLLGFLALSPFATWFLGEKVKKLEWKYEEIYKS